MAAVATSCRIGHSTPGLEVVRLVLYPPLLLLLIYCYSIHPWPGLLVLFSWFCGALSTPAVQCIHPWTGLRLLCLRAVPDVVRLAVRLVLLLYPPLDRSCHVPVSAAASRVRPALLRPPRLLLVIRGAAVPPWLLLDRETTDNSNTT